IRYPGLRQALQDRQVVLGPMTAEQVRDAVARPARLAQSDVDDDLVTLLLADLAPPGGDADGDGGAAYEPGAPPLLSHAMLATWERSRGQALTARAYLASGGVQEPAPHRRRLPGQRRDQGRAHPHRGAGLREPGRRRAHAGPPAVPAAGARL